MNYCDARRPHIGHKDKNGCEICMYDTVLTEEGKEAVVVLFPGPGTAGSPNFILDFGPSCYVLYPDFDKCVIKQEGKHEN